MTLCHTRTSIAINIGQTSTAGPNRPQACPRSAKQIDPAPRQKLTVKHCSSQESSCATVLRSLGSTCQKNTWRELFRYGETCSFFVYSLIPRSPDSDYDLLMHFVAAECRQDRRRTGGLRRIRTDVHKIQNQTSHRRGVEGNRSKMAITWYVSIAKVVVTVTLQTQLLSRSWAECLAMVIFKFVVVIGIVTAMHIPSSTGAHVAADAELERY